MAKSHPAFDLCKIRREAGLICAAILTLLAPICPSAAQDASAPRDGFVVRSGARLMLDGRPFRFAGANIDWLGIGSHSYYEPDVFYPDPAEVDDALATVVEMGGTVVRSHSLGISVGCPQCIAPEKGKYNEAALRRVDYALKRAADLKLKVIIPLLDGVGADCRKRPDGTFSDALYTGNTCEFLSWNNDTDRNNFHTNPAVIEDFKAYVSHILNRKNTLTGIAYKDDPTIMAWETCNACGSRGEQAVLATWIADVARHIKSIDRKHLLIEGSSMLRYAAPGSWTPPAEIDVICFQYYPYWDKFISSRTGRPRDSSPASLDKHANMVASLDRPYMACEFGWDPANWRSQADLEAFLTGVKNNPNVAGALFWNLEGHAADRGWMPVHGPAKPGLHTAQEDLMPGGDWWAFYYTGRNTRWNEAADMFARGQAIRKFSYEMTGRVVPPLLVPAAPLITGTRGGLVRWRGSVGASLYSIEVAKSAKGPWSVGCDRCATDEMGQWQDPGVAGPAWYRVVPFNPDGKRGTPSKAAPRRDD